MILLFQILVLFTILWATAYFRIRMGSALAAAGAALVMMTVTSEFLVIPWLLFSPVALLFFADDLRKDKITRPVFKFFKKVLPPMNQTEKEALDAGDVWWDGELFKGNPDWDSMLQVKAPTLSEEEQSFIDNQVEHVCNLVSDWDISFKDKDLPAEAWEYLKKEGFLGLIIPKEYGGKGFSAFGHSSIVTKLASRSGALGVSTMVPNSLGPAELLLHYGTDEQKNHYLPRLAKGIDIPCFALTGPTAGSDAGAMPDDGIVCEQEFEGKKTLGIRLNWNKRYITLAPVATVLGLAFKLYDPDNLMGEEKDLGITVALIPTSHEGVEIGTRHYPVGSPFMNGPTYGKDVFIPMSWIVGGQDFAGKGWKMLVECLSAGRGISLPSGATAAAKVAYRATGAYSVLRKQFKTEIGRFEGVEEALARIAGNTYQMEAARITTAGAVDAGYKPSVVTAIAKYHMTEAARSLINDAMDIHGGRGVIQGERNYLANGFMGTPVSITVEGANILTRNLMIFGQGAVRCHPFVYKEMQAASHENEEKGLDEFDSLLFRHIGYGVSNFIRTISLGVTGGRVARKPVKGDTAYYYQQLTRMSSALALVSDLSMAVLGGELKRKERLSARLGDVLSYLYMSSTVLKYYQDNGQKEADLVYVKWTLERNLFLIQTAFNEFLENFKPKWLGAMLKRIIFPFGNAYRLPNDKLDHKVVQAMLSENELRNRLTKNIFIGDKEQPVGRIENAFQLVLASSETAAKIRKAIKEKQVSVASGMEDALTQAVKLNILSKQEADQYLDAEVARLDAIQVDDYSKEYIKGEKVETSTESNEAAA
jgi:alkylation response protein AidB-like acyl-CoA dehydrogenase